VTNPQHIRQAFSGRALALALLAFAACSGYALCFEPTLVGHASFADRLTSSPVEPSESEADVGQAVSVARALVTRGRVGPSALPSARVATAFVLDRRHYALCAEPDCTALGYRPTVRSMCPLARSSCEDAGDDPATRA
jgi:hypothetical protein